eukprot:s2553_g8.t1
MGSRTLALLACLGICHFFQAGDEQWSRTGVAPEAKADTPTVQDFPPEFQIPLSWETNEMEDSEGNLVPCKAPFIPISRDSSPGSLSHQNDVALPDMPHQQQREIRNMQIVSGSLEVWVPPVKRRSRSKSAAKKKDQKGQQGHQPAAEEWQVFPDKVPWIASTPATRHGQVSVSAETPLGNQKKETFSLQSLQNPPSTIAKEEGFTEEEKKVLAHLRGLQSMNVPLPEDLQAQAGLLEAKEKEQIAAKALSHGHLNKLTKIKSQVNAQAKKIEALDREWAGFAQKISEKVAHHASMYQACRQDMLETYNGKLEEMRKLKLELSQASRSLLDQDGEMPEFAEPAHITEQLQAMQAALTAAGTVDVVDLIDEGDSEMEIMDPPSETSKDGRPAGKTSFRGASSPQKVAQNHLKVKKRENKDGKETGKDVKTDNTAQ